MSAPVNALAVLRAARDSVPAEQLLDYCTAVAAMAELIKASNEMLRVERTQGVTDAEFEAAVEALDAALTRVQGGAQ